VLLALDHAHLALGGNDFRQGLEVRANLHNGQFAIHIGKLGLDHGAGVALAGNGFIRPPLAQGGHTLVLALGGFGVLGRGRGLGLTLGSLGSLFVVGVDGGHQVKAFAGLGGFVVLDGNINGGVDGFTIVINLASINGKHVLVGNADIDGIGEHFHYLGQDCGQGFGAKFVLHNWDTSFLFSVPLLRTYLLYHTFGDWSSIFFVKFLTSG